MSDSAVVSATPPTLAAAGIRSTDHEQQKNSPSPSDDGGSAKLLTKSASKSDDDDCLIIDDDNHDENTEADEAAREAQTQKDEPSAAKLLSTPAKSSTSNNNSTFLSLDNGSPSVDPKRKTSNASDTSAKSTGFKTTTSSDKSMKASSSVGTPEKSGEVSTVPNKIPTTSTETQSSIITSTTTAQALPSATVTTSATTKSCLSVENLTQHSTTNAVSATSSRLSTSNAVFTTDTATTTSTAQVTTLAETLSTKLKKPRQRKPNAAKKIEAIQQQPMIAQLMGQNGVVGTIQMPANGQPQYITLPAGYKFNNLGQIVASSAPSNPNTSPNPPSMMSAQFRQTSTPSGYVIQNPNGQFVFVQSAAPTSTATLHSPAGGQSATNSGNKSATAGQKKNNKDKEAINSTNGSQQQQNPMMLMQGNYRLQLPPGSQPSQSVVMKQMPMSSSTPTTSTNNKISNASPAALSSASASSVAQSYFTTAPTAPLPANLVQTGGVYYAARAPTGPITFRSASGPSLMFNPNLIPVNLPANCQYQFMTVPTLNLQELPPPPTLSPNPPKSPKPPATVNSAAANKKKGVSNTLPANGPTTTNGIFANESAKFMATNMPSLSALKPVMPTKMKTEEKMDIDKADLNDDEPPPEIECEGHAESIGSNSASTNQRERAQQNFLHAAQRQPHQRQKLTSQQLLLKKHFVDGHVIEEEVHAPSHHQQHQKQQSSHQQSQTPTKQRKVGQPPCSQPVGGARSSDSTLRNTSKAVLSNFASVLNRTQAAPPKALGKVVSRPFPANFQQPPPIVKPANYNPPSTPPFAKDSPVKKEPKLSAKTTMRTSDPPRPTTSVAPSNGQSHKQQKPSNDTQRKSRGRPPKVTTTPLTGNDSSFGRRSDNDLKTKVTSDSIDKPRQKKNREVENLINMDFGPGKTPFETTSADQYTEKILTSREQLESLGYDGRHSRASVTSNSSRPLHSSGRRTSQRQFSHSNLTPPEAKRPRRDVQRNVSYKHPPDFETEDDSDRDDHEEIEVEERKVPVNTCLYCKQSARDPKLPQYCNEECKRKFKKKQRLERFSNKYLSTSITSTASFISEPSTSTISNNQDVKNRLSLDGFASPPTAFTIKIASPTSGSEKIKCDGSGNGSFEAVSSGANGNDQSDNARELDKLKSMGVRNWSTTDVARWVELVCGSVEIGAKFAEQEIDGDSLLLLNENELKQDLGLKLGPCMKLMKDLKKIKAME